ncbi:MAG: hypothetical protein Q8934_03100 [Bacillota bacterium]|nr:hypothetical protein [Bacillota bacterium]
MKQVIQLDQQLKERILNMETEFETICKKLEKANQKYFERYEYQIVIELIRVKSGKGAKSLDIFEDDYESFIEIGIEHEGEYYPNTYIPIWKCKTEWFQKIGYLTKQNNVDLENKLQLIIKEMLEDAEVSSSEDR